VYTVYGQYGQWMVHTLAGAAGAWFIRTGGFVVNFVVDVDTVCLFKTRLDKFWMHQDVMYDFAADLTGIGDRSVREIS